MTDRELLELAAKAAGIEIDQIDAAHKPEDWCNWNPLEDDGDALRLAVKLGLWVQISERCAWTQQNENILSSFSARSMVMFTETNNNSYAATRRAIVKAAAEIGKESKCTKT